MLVFNSHTGLGIKMGFESYLRVHYKQILLYTNNFVVLLEYYTGNVFDCNKLHTSMWNKVFRKLVQVTSTCLTATFEL